MTTVAPADPKRPRRAMGIKTEGVDNGQRRRAATVLEVLAGIRTPTQAASALSVSLGAYYKLECRALRAMIDGCGPAGKGPTPSPEAQRAKLERRCERLQQELQRYQALARAAHRAVGLTPAKSPSPTDGKQRRRRRPTVRALKAVAALQSGSAEPCSQES